MNIDEITYKDCSEFLSGFSVIILKKNYRNMDEKTMFLTIYRELIQKNGSLTLIN